MSSLLQICGVAITAAVCAVIIKKLSHTSGMILPAFAIVIIIILVMKKYEGAVEKIRELTEGAYFKNCQELMLKSLGIGITVKISTDICRSLGEEGIAGGIELAGKLEILFLCFPLILELISVSTELLL